MIHWQAESRLIFSIYKDQSRSEKMQSCFLLKGCNLMTTGVAHIIKQ